MSDQFNRQKITREIERIKSEAKQAQKEVVEMRRIFNQAHAQVVQERDEAHERIKQLEARILKMQHEWNADVGRVMKERDELRRFAYEDAPRIATKEADDQTAALRDEVERLRQELGYIANAHRRSFKNAQEFRTWAQNRACHAIGQKPGELAIKKEGGHE